MDHFHPFFPPKSPGNLPIFAWDRLRHDRGIRHSQPLEPQDVAFGIHDLATTTIDVPSGYVKIAIENGHL